MKTRFDPKGSPAIFSRMMKELQDEPDVGGLLVFSCDANAWSPEYITPMVQTISKPVFGGIFPQIIYENTALDTGTLILGLPVIPEVAVISSLSQSNIDYTGEIQPYAEIWDLADHSSDETLFVFVDGLSKSIAKFIDSLFICFGLERNFIGGGAGSLSFQNKPCLITPDGLVSESAIVVRLPVQSNVGFAHGWIPISESIKATDTHFNIIKSLEWLPALDVYGEFVQSHSGQALSSDNFYELAKRYPLGITKFESEMIIRTPLLATPEKELLCIGEIPKSGFVRILTGTPDSLLSATTRAMHNRPQNFPAKTCITNICFTGISRALLFGDQLKRELDIINPTQPVYGAVTLGEIVSKGTDYPELFNNTLVWGMIR